MFYRYLLCYYLELFSEALAARQHMDKSDTVQCSSFQGRDNTKDAAQDIEQDPGQH